MQNHRHHANKNDKTCHNFKKLNQSLSRFKDMKKLDIPIDRSIKCSNMFHYTLKILIKRFYFTIFDFRSLTFLLKVR